MSLRMRIPSPIIYSLIFAPFLSGCGYTVLSDRTPCPPKSNLSLPDLEIVSIEGLRSHITGSTVEHLPVKITTFSITIQNVGRTSFNGSVQVVFADNQKDINADKYPVRGNRENAVLLVGNRSLVKVRRYGWYEPGTRLAFFLESDSNCFGCDRICEVSYENNYAQFVMP